MSIERWNPFREMETMRSVLDRFFDDSFLSSPISRLGGTITPPLDITETEEGYELHASVPGYTADQIQLDLNGDILTLRGETGNQEHEEQRGNYIYRERSSGSFYRQVRLPQHVDSSKTEAVLEHGVLQLKLPRQKETGGQRLAIKNGNGTEAVKADTSK